MLKYFVFLSLIFVCSAQKISLGKCPDVPVQRNFNATAYLGKWYQYEKYPNLFELGGKCNSALYTDEGNGTVGVFNKQYGIENNAENNITGYAVLADPNSDEGKLLVYFPGNMTGSPYWVLGTDYKSYTTIFSCEKIGLLKAEFVWVLTRAQKPTSATIKKAEALLTDNDIDTDFIQKSIQDDCPDDAIYY